MYVVLSIENCIDVVVVMFVNENVKNMTWLIEWLLPGVDYGCVVVETQISHHKLKKMRWNISEKDVTVAQNW